MSRLDLTFQAPIVTAQGRFVATYSNRGLRSLDFPQKKGREPKATGELPEEMRVWHQLTTTAVEAILSGKPVRKLPPLDLGSATVFQKKVWAALQAIETGQTRSYSEVARAIGRPAAARAVGMACGANPIPLLIPCHRVLAANKKLGGFSAGLDWKRLLLSREGASKSLI